MILVGLFFLFLGKIQSQSTNPPAGCSGYMFLGENSYVTCTQHLTFLQVANDTVGRYFSDGNGFAARGFGSKDTWLLLDYTNIQNFTLTMMEWIQTYSRNNCSDSEAVNFTNPLQDILNHLNRGYHKYGIFLEAETDTIVDLSTAMPLAQQIATYDADIYVWDISVNNNDNNLFETLTGNKPGHILRGANLTYNDVMGFLACSMIPEFKNFSCNQLPVTLPPGLNCPSTTAGPITYPTTRYQTSQPWTTATPPTTNISCTSLELIFILDRSESIVPYIYNSDANQFVINFASQFSFPNEVSSGSDYARFGVIQFADTAEVSIPLGDYTRSNFISQVQQKVKFGDGGIKNLLGALQAAYAQFQSNSILSNKAVMLIVDDVSLIAEVRDAMARLDTFVDLPMGVIIPGFTSTPEKGLADLTILLGNNSQLAFANISMALSNAPSLISNTYPCQLPAACSVLCFIEEATVVIGAEAKLNFLKLVQRLVTTVAFNPHQRFSISFFGESIYKAIEAQEFDIFNKTLTAFIDTLSSDDSPNGGRTFLAPILNQYTSFFNSNIYKNASALLLAEIEALRDPTAAYSACQTVASLGTDFYVIDQSRFAGPSSLFSTCTGGKPGHILNGTALSQDQLFNQLRDSLIQNFNFMRC